jgi:hypothetical protein
MRPHTGGGGGVSSNNVIRPIVINGPSGVGKGAELGFDFRIFFHSRMTLCPHTIAGVEASIRVIQCRASAAVPLLLLTRKLCHNMKAHE